MCTKTTSDKGIASSSYIWYAKPTTTYKMTFTPTAADLTEVT
jgi:hypothetical protein